MIYRMSNAILRMPTERVGVVGASNIVVQALLTVLNSLYNVLNPLSNVLNLLYNILNAFHSDPEQCKNRIVQHFAWLSSYWDGHLPRTTDYSAAYAYQFSVQH